MKQAFMAFAIAVCPLLCGFADEVLQPPGPVIVVQFLGFSDTQAAQFTQLLQTLQATAGGLQQQIGPKQQALVTLLSFLALLTSDQRQKTQAVVQAAQLLPAVKAFAEVRLIEPPR